MAAVNLPSFSRGSSTFQSATISSESTSLLNSYHQNLIYFLTVLQKVCIDIIPLTWQPALENLGQGASSSISQALISAQMTFAFKRSQLASDYRALISEISILTIPRVRNHPNIVNVEGIGWEYRGSDEDGNKGVVPVLIYAKADHGDLSEFLKSEKGRVLGLEGRLQICTNVASAFALLHDCNVIHGDVKPQNILVFSNDQPGELIAKVADFGFSSLLTAEREDIYLPRTRPWDAPEWHHRGISLDDAKHMDAYSFGLLCLWVFALHSHPIARSLYNTFLENGSWNASTLEFGKAKGTILDTVNTAFEIGIAETNDTVNAFRELFNATLQSNPSARYLGINLNTESIAFQEMEGLLPRHISLDVTESYLILQLASSDYRVRQAVCSELYLLVQSNHCENCRNVACFQLAMLKSIGLGIGRDLPAASALLSMSNMTADDLAEGIRNINAITNQPQFRPGIVQDMRDQATSLYNQDESRWLREPETVQALENARWKEIVALSQSLGRNHILSCLTKSSFTDYLIHHDQQRMDECIQLRRECVQAMSSIFGSKHPQTADMMQNLGQALGYDGQLEEAREYMEESLNIMLASYGQDSALSLNAEMALAWVREQQGEFREWVRLNEEMLRDKENMLGKYHALTCCVLLDLANAYITADMQSEALRAAEDLLHRFQTTFGETHMLTPRAKVAASSIYQRLGDNQTSIRLQKEAVQHFRDHLGPKHHHTILSEAELAADLQNFGEYLEAERILRSCLAKANFKPDHESSLRVQILSSLAISLKKNRPTA